MNYELAKKLKDAGWPQPDKKGDNYGGKSNEGYSPDGVKIDYSEEFGWTASKMSDYFPEIIYVPILSELIEACTKLTKDGDFHLEAMHGRWGASTCWKEKDDWENGNTPEEAVAYLWLELNNKTPL